MKCFSACFGTKHKGTMKIQDQLCLSPSHEALLAAGEKSLKEEEETVNPIELDSESNVESEELLTGSNRNKITDYSNINTHTDDLINGIVENLVENGTGELENKTENGKNDDDDEPDSKAIHGHQEFLTGDKENEVAMMTSKECTLDDRNSKENNNWADFSFVQPESSDSLFSLSIDSRRQVYAVEVGEKEVCSPFKLNNDRENNSELEVIDEVNTDPPPLKYEDKENIVNSEEKSSIVKSWDDEIVVGSTSLSSWLVEQKSNSPQMKSIGNSPDSEKNYGNRQVLGEINGEVVEKMNKCLSGRSTPRCGVHDQPEFGTVGGYMQRRGRREVVEMDLRSCQG